MDKLKETLLEAPNSQISDTVKEIIRRWPANPKAINYLEVLDHAVRYAGASGFILKILNMLYKDALKAENKTHEEITIKATWRRS